MRRFARYVAARDAGELTDDGRPAIDPTTGKPRKFAYAPQLVVVDGGAPQVNAAGAVLRALGITDIAVCGLAKRLEEVWQPDEPFPVIFSRTAEGLYLLQRVRDEAHRFAITFHRQRRSKRMTVSALETVPGLGDVRRKALLRHFGSLKRIKTASVEEIAEVPGVGRRTAEAILAALAPPEAPTDARPPDVLPPDVRPADEARPEERVEQQPEQPPTGEKPAAEGTGAEQTGIAT